MAPGDIFLLIAAQIIPAVLIVVTSIHVSRRLHDAVPSTIRSGVASGVGAISWIVFLPIALVFGLISTEHGVHTAGWTLTALTTLAAALLAYSARKEKPLQAGRIQPGARHGARACAAPRSR